MIDKVTYYIENLIAKAYGLKLDNSLNFSKQFDLLIKKKQLSHDKWFKKEPLLYDENNEPDYLGTCFYMLNSLQEYQVKNLDKFNRFQFKDSYQSKFSCEKDNLVDSYFRTYFKEQNINLAQNPSSFFISHDIDLLYGGISQDLFFQLKKKDILGMLKSIFNYALGERRWKNIEQILKMESEADVKATFFWIVANSYDKKHNIKNGDYAPNNLYVQEKQKQIKDAALFENGLHKSSFSSYSFEYELDKFKVDTIKTNRNHYLKFNLPVHYNNIENAGLETDCSLGFQEVIGYRNSFGLPFKPFNLEEKRSYEFLEIPLQIMDTTFLTYQKISAKEIENQIIDFIDKAKLNHVISILWHNDKLTDLKFNHMLLIFKKLLVLIKESKLETNLSSDLYKKYF